jgi:hypothetical protein
MDSEIMHLPKNKIFSIDINQDTVFALLVDDLLQVAYRGVNRKRDFKSCRIAIYKTPECAKFIARHR